LILRARIYRWASSFKTIVPLPEHVVVRMANHAENGRRKKEKDDETEKE
jgi:hypothetical protein